MKSIPREKIYLNVRLDILRFLRQNPEGTSRQIANFYKISERQARLDLAALRELGAIRRIRRGRRFFYVVKEQR